MQTVIRVTLAALLISSAAGRAADGTLNLAYICEAGGENGMGIVAAGIVAANEINAGTNLPAEFGTCKPQVALSLHDHAVDPNTAAKIAITGGGLPPDQVYDGIIGPDYSSISVVVSPVASVFSMPVMSYWATSPKLNDDAYSNFFRTIPDDVAAALAVLDYLKVNKIKNANVAYSNDPYGIGFAEGLLKDASNFGVKMESFALTKDTTELGRTIEKSQLNVWILVMGGSDIKQFVGPMLKEITRDIHYIFSETMSNSILPTLSQKEQLQLTGSVIIKAQALKPGNKKADDLIKKMGISGAGLTNADTVKLDPTNKFEYRKSKCAACTDAGCGEDAAYGAGACSKVDAASTDDRKFPSLHDIAGFSYDAVYAYALAACKADEKKAAGITKACTAEEKDLSKCVTPFIINTDITMADGASGPLKFVASGTRDPATAYMTTTLAQVNKDGKGINFNPDNEYIGKWLKPFGAITAGTGDNPFSELTPVPKCSEAALKLPVKDRIPVCLEEVRVSSGIEYVVFIMSGISIISSIFFTVWSLINHEAPVVNRAQPGFLYAMCFGCILSSSVPILMAVRSQAFCQATWIVYGVGFSITMGSLAAKTIRIYRIFSNKALKKMKLTAANSMPPMVGIMVVDVAIAVIMVATGDVNYSSVTTAADAFDRPTQMEFRCLAKGPATTAFFIWNIALLLFLAVLCYISRGINSAFSESKYISMSVGSALQIIVLGFLLISAMDATPSVGYLMVSLMTLVTDWSTLYLIFIPKLYSHYSGESEGNATGTSGTSGTSKTVGTSQGSEGGPRKCSDIVPSDGDKEEARA